MGQLLRSAMSVTFQFFLFSLSCKGAVAAFNHLPRCSFINKCHEVRSELRRSRTCHETSRKASSLSPPLCSVNSAHAVLQKHCDSRPGATYKFILLIEKCVLLFQTVMSITVSLYADFGSTVRFRLHCLASELSKYVESTL